MAPASNKKNPKKKEKKPEIIPGVTPLTGKQQIFYQILRSKLGNISGACAEMGIDRVTFYNWKNKDPNFKKWVEENVEDEMVQITETAMMNEIMKGNPSLIKYHLEKKGHKRGYGPVDTPTEGNRGVVINMVSMSDEAIRKKLKEQRDADTKSPDHK